MAMVTHRPRIKVSTLTSGTADFTLGPAVNLSFQNFAAAGVPTGSIIDYSAYTADQFECGTGIYNATAGMLSRVTIYSSSNGGAKVNFTSNPTVVSTFLPQRYLRRNIDYLDIHDFTTGLLDDPYSDITDALNAAMDYGDFNNQHRIRISPYVSIAGVVNSNLAQYGTLIWPAITPGETAWTIEYDIAKLLVGTTMAPPGGTSLVGINTLQTGGTGQNGPAPAPLIFTHAPGQTQHPATVFCDPIVNWNGAVKSRLENISFLSGNGGCFFGTGPELVVIRNCTFGSTGGTNPAVIFDHGFWFTLDRVSASAVTAPFSIDLRNTGGGTDTGLCRISDTRLGAAGMRFYASGGGSVNNFQISDLISEDIRAGHSLVTLEVSGSGGIGMIRFLNSIGNADPVDFNDNYIFNVIGNGINGISVDWSAHTGTDVALFKPGSATIREFYIDGTLTQVQDSTAVRLEDNYIGTGHQQNYGIEYVTAMDKKLLTAPFTPALAIGDVYPLSQNPASWTKLSGTDLTTGIRGPDGSLNAVLIPADAQYRCFYTNAHTVNTADWIIVGTGVQMPGTDSNAKVVNFQVQFVFEGATGDINGIGGQETGMLASCNEDYAVNQGWRFLCKAFKVTGTSGYPKTVTMRMILGGGGQAGHVFMPCVMNLGQVKDRFAINVARSMRGPWSSTVNRRGTWTALDHQAMYAGQGIMLKEGVTAPATMAGVGQLYIEGGAIKMKLGDGTVRTFTVT